MESTLHEKKFEGIPVGYTLREEEPGEGEGNKRKEKKKKDEKGRRMKLDQQAINNAY